MELLIDFKKVVLERNKIKRATPISQPKPKEEKKGVGRTQKQIICGLGGYHDS